MVVSVAAGRPARSVRQSLNVWRVFEKKLWRKVLHSVKTLTSSALAPSPGLVGLTGEKRPSQKVPPNVRTLTSATFLTVGLGRLGGGGPSGVAEVVFPAGFRVTKRTQFHSGGAMAKSKFEYVRQFETEDRLLPNCWIVVRVDGKAFHRFTDSHHYMKPNDERGLNLMTRAAQNVMEDFKDIVLAYGQSDEYSFVFHKNTNIYNRRGSKIMTSVVSLFSSSFTMLWPRYFSTQVLQYAATFDARVVLYPSDQNIKDYLSWRQADCHINNLYNTCFWKLVQERGLTPGQAQERLKGTLSSDKNELLFSDFKLNYNTLPELYRKGSILIRCKDGMPPETRPMTGGLQMTLVGNQGNTKARASTVVMHCDLIGKQFWEEHPEILGPKAK